MNLKIENLLKQFAKLDVIKDINIDIQNVKSIGIIGPSGGGKSTLLRLISGLESITEGNITINKHLLTNEDKKQSLEFHKNIGVVSQQYNLFPHLAALRNITIVLEKVHGKSLEEANVKALHLFEKFGLIEHKDKKPYQLSGGQKQRIAIIRALAIDAELIMLDEPTAALDPILTLEVLEMIMTLKKEEKEFIIVTHEMGFARNVADYILYMDDGKILEHGCANEIFENPKTDELKSFLSKILEWKINDEKK